MPSNFLTSFVKRLRWFAQGMKEQEAVKVDELVLEHLLFYHGLIGTSSENQREFKEVKADILEALADRSPSALSIGLKLPPLLWEEKLKSIFLALDSEERKLAIDLLAPQESADENSPLKHQDWRVRANAANMLVVLQERSASIKLIPLLADTSDSGKLAFGHIAYAIGKLQTEEGLLALAEYIEHPKPWLQVDIAGALAFYSLEKSGALLAQALLFESELKDYMAVAVTKQHSPQKFLTASNPAIKDAGCELVLGILAASDNSFDHNIVLDNSLPECLELLAKHAISEPTPLRVAATLSLIDWLLNQEGSKKIELETQRNKILSQEAVTNILNNLRQDLKGTSNKAAVKHAIKLAGQLRLIEAEPILLSALSLESPFLNDLIEALGLIGQPSPLPILIKLAHQLVDVEDRNERPKSKQPVLEEDPAKAKTYWVLLKALGNFTEPESAKFLLAANSDFAPDKRAQALSALVTLVTKANATKVDVANSLDNFQFEVTKVLSEGLADTSPLVQLAALDGAAQLVADNLINEMAHLLDSHENTVSKQALISLSQIAQKGHGAKVAEALQAKLKREREEYKKQRIQMLLKSIGK